MKKLATILFWSGLGIFATGLLLYIYLGIYNRLWADDWCYNADLVTLGFWGTIKGYAFITHYASNRYSLTLFTLLMQLLGGVFSAQIMALLVVTLWFGGLFMVIQGIDHLFGLNLKTLGIALVTAIIEYYSLYLAPNQFQNLYFRSATLTYSAPLIFSLFIFGLLLWQMNHEERSRLVIFLIALLAFFAGGFSEGGCAYLGAALGILWLAALIYRKKGFNWAKRVFVPVSVALVCVVLALVVLVLSPAIPARYEGNYHEPTNPLLVPGLSLIFTFDFIQTSLRGLIIPHIMLGLIFLLIPFLTTHTGANAENSLLKSTKAMFVIAICAILVIAASQAPTTYVEKGPPAPRGLIFSRFTLTLAFAAICWLLGNYLTTRVKSNYANLLMLLIVVPFLYTLRPITSTYAELPRAIQRAKTWDERDASILAAKRQGNLKIDVKGIDSQYIGHTLDFKEKPTFWINSCAEVYYGMDEILATSP